MELKYTDLFAQRQESERLPVLVALGAGETYDPLRDVEVLRNVTIQRTAEGLKEIDRLYKERSYREAWNLAYGLEQELRDVAALTQEEQMVKDADLMRKYEDTLSGWVESDREVSPVPPTTTRRRPVCSAAHPPRRRR